MAGTKKFGEENYISNNMGIPAYDYISNTYDGNQNLTQIVYRIGGSSGDIVATVVMTYDGNNNLSTVERTV